LLLIVLSIKLTTPGGSDTSAIFIFGSLYLYQCLLLVLFARQEGIYRQIWVCDGLSLYSYHGTGQGFTCVQSWMSQHCQDSY